MVFTTEYGLILLGAITGVALSAAVGFRIFVPFLVAGIAVKLGALHVAPDFAWLSSWPALAVFVVASVTEVLAYYIPVVDHALDVIGSPAAVIAGTLLTASMVVGMDEWLRWRLLPAVGLLVRCMLVNRWCGVYRLPRLLGWVIRLWPPVKYLGR